jgi:hypothetical protein
LNQSSPVISVSGRTSMPDELMSTSRKLSPSCFFFASGSLRTIRMHQSACWAKLVQIFCPLTTTSSPRSSPRVRRAARSEPASGSEKP